MFLSDYIAHFSFKWPITRVKMYAPFRGDRAGAASPNTCLMWLPRFLCIKLKKEYNTIYLHLLGQIIENNVKAFIVLKKF